MIDLSSLGHAGASMRLDARARLLYAALLAHAAIGSAGAHHSYAAYDEDREIRLEGKLAALAFVNPHARIELLVESGGEARRWDVEWAGAGTLLGQGFSEHTLAAGDTLVLTGNPARDPARRALRLTTLTRPADGLAWGSPGQTSD